MADADDTRTCSKCNARKPVTEFYLSKPNTCKACHAARGRELWELNGATQRQKRSERYWADPEKGREVSRLYQRTRAEDRAAKRRERAAQKHAVEADAGRMCKECGERQPTSEFRLKGRICEKCRRELAAAYWRDNPDKRRAIKLRMVAKYGWGKANGHSPESRARERKRAKEIYHADLAKARARCRAKNATRRVAYESVYDAGDVAAIVKAQKGRCAYCRDRLPKHGFCMDHIHPVSKGGTSDRFNMQATCRTCNAKKHAKDPIDFARSLGLLL